MFQVKDLSIGKIHSVIYTPEIDAFSATKSLAAILSKYATLFDGQLQVLPLQSDVPPEIPRIILQSQNGDYKLDIAPSQTIAYWGNAIVEPGDSVRKQNEINLLGEILESYVQDIKASVGRLAVVTTHLYQTEKPAALLIEHFCSKSTIENVFKNSDNFEIHNHKRITLEDFSINVWVRCKTATVQGEADSTFILIEQDFNTLAEEVSYRRFATEQIRKFYQLSLEKTQSVLETYFPG